MLAPKLSSFPPLSIAAALQTFHERSHHRNKNAFLSPPRRLSPVDVVAVVVALVPDDDPLPVSHVGPRHARTLLSDASLSPGFAVRARIPLNEAAVPPGTVIRLCGLRLRRWCGAADPERLWPPRAATAPTDPPPPLQAIADWALSWQEPEEDPAVVITAELDGPSRGERRPPEGDEEVRAAGRAREWYTALYPGGASRGGLSRPTFTTRKRTFVAALTSALRVRDLAGRGCAGRDVESVLACVEGTGLRISLVDAGTGRMLSELEDRASLCLAGWESIMARIAEAAGRPVLMTFLRVQSGGGDENDLMLAPTTNTEVLLPSNSNEELALDLYLNAARQKCGEEEDGTQILAMAPVGDGNAAGETWYLRSANIAEFYVPALKRNIRVQPLKSEKDAVDVLVLAAETSYRPAILGLRRSQGDGGSGEKGSVVVAHIASEMVEQICGGIPSHNILENTESGGVCARKVMYDFVQGLLDHDVPIDWKLGPLEGGDGWEVLDVRLCDVEIHV